MNNQGGLMNAELIKALREDAEWAHANEWETPITLGDHLDAAADRLEAADKREEAQRWISVKERLPAVSEYRNGDKFKSMDSNELVPFLVFTGLTPSDIADLRNELCLKCGQYRRAHLGSCDSCRWKKGAHE